MELDVRYTAFYEVRGFARRSGDQQAVVGGDDPLGDRGNLLRRLARPENDFRKALAKCAMMIDAGEAQIFEGRLAQNLKDPVLRRLRCNVSGGHLLEEDGKLLSVHRAKWLGYVDFRASRTVISRIVLRNGFMSL